MIITNADVAAAFNEIADLLDISGANQFRIRAYRNASRVIGDLSHDLQDLIAKGEHLDDLPGIGKDLSGKITEYLETGHCRMLEELRKKSPSGITDLLRVPGLGPRKAAELNKSLHIHTIEDLAQACHHHKVCKLHGFGEHTECKILDELEGERPKETRIKRHTAQQYARPMIDYFERSPLITKAIVAGSYRRKKETAGDLDILLIAEDGPGAISHVLSYDDVVRVLARGHTKATFVLRSNLQVDVRVVERHCLGAALHYFTGSKAHNIALRTIAHEGGLKLNECGLFKDDITLPMETEEQLFLSLGLPYIEPELRENRGEIEAAAAGLLPVLVELKDLRGDLHSHTKATDGRDTLVRMAAAAKKHGMEYLAITDHSRRMSMTHGLDEARLLLQLEEIDFLNEHLEGIRLLKGLEVDILADGTLDMADRVLRRLDLTVCSVHTKFNLSRSEQTKRIMKAMDNPYCSILGHPSGRLIEERRPYDADMQALIEYAAKRGCILEVNSHPERLDLTDVYCRTAKESGALLAINSDAHSVYDFENLRFGVDQARRGWLEKKDVVNTRPLDELLNILAMKKTPTAPASNP